MMLHISFPYKNIVIQLIKIREGYHDWCKTPTFFESAYIQKKDDIFVSVSSFVYVLEDRLLYEFIRYTMS